MSHAILEYDRGVEPARKRFADRPWARTVFAEAPAKGHLEMFLLEMCSRGVYMTAPVADWIRRAGGQCQRVGFSRLGRALVRHAASEEGHDQLFRHDAHALAERRAALGFPLIDASAMCARPPTDSMRAYARLHEEIIAGESPFAQLAIEYEIESLSLSYGRKVVDRCIASLGPDIMDCLTFITEHVKVDAGHTRFNRAQLERFLGASPDALPAMTEAGTAALDCYGGFLDDCALGA
jgi:hypothetical protein